MATKGGSGFKLEFVAFAIYQQGNPFHDNELTIIGICTFASEPLKEQQDRYQKAGGKRKTYGTFCDLMQSKKIRPSLELLQLNIDVIMLIFSMLDMNSLAALSRSCKKAKGYVDYLSLWSKELVRCHINSLDKRLVKSLTCKRIHMMMVMSLPCDIPKRTIVDSLNILCMYSTLTVLFLHLVIGEADCIESLPELKNLKLASLILEAVTATQLKALLHSLKNVQVFSLLLLPDVNCLTLKLRQREQLKHQAALNSKFINHITETLKYIEDIEIKALQHFPEIPAINYSRLSQMKRLSINSIHSAGRHRPHYTDICCRIWEKALFYENLLSRSMGLFANPDWTKLPPDFLQRISTYPNSNLTILELALSCHCSGNGRNSDVLNQLPNLRSLCVAGVIVCNMNAIYQLCTGSLNNLFIQHADHQYKHTSRSENEYLPLEAIAERFPELKTLVIRGHTNHLWRLHQSETTIRGYKCIAEKMKRLSTMHIKVDDTKGYYPADSSEYELNAIANILMEMESLESFSGFHELNRFLRETDRYPPHIKYTEHQVSYNIAGTPLEKTLYRMDGEWHNVPIDSHMWHEAHGSSDFQLESSATTLKQASQAIKSWRTTNAQFDMYAKLLE